MVGFSILEMFRHQLDIARQGSLKLKPRLRAVMNIPTLQALVREFEHEALREKTRTDFRATDPDGPTGLELHGVSLWIDRRVKGDGIRFEPERLTP